MSTKSLGPGTFLITGGIADYVRQCRRFWTDEAIRKRREDKRRIQVTFKHVK